MIATEAFYAPRFLFLGELYKWDWIPYSTRVSKSARKSSIFTIIILLTVGLCFVGVLLLRKDAATPAPGPEEKIVMPKDVAADAALASSLPSDFATVEAFFAKLAEEKGAVYAFDVLIASHIPPSVDVHFIGHKVGDMLYEEYGIEGMKYCTHDLRNACSHSVVIGALLAEGESILPKLNPICHEAPGGVGAYTLCYHGLGHGTLAYAGYDIKRGIELCGLVTNETPFREEQVQCIGGVVMEMNIGAHDPEVWKEMKQKQLTVSRPLEICQSDYIPNIAKVMCYSYVTPYLLEAAAETATSQMDQLKKSFLYCDILDKKAQRRACYGGMGKEFVTLALGGDTRISKIATDQELNYLISLCSLAHNDEANSACILTALDTMYWGGENNPDASVRLCGLLPEGSTREDCFKHLFSITEYYQQDPIIRERICAEVAEDAEHACRSTLLFDRRDFE
jgi:hypothetical protein